MQVYLRQFQDQIQLANVGVAPVEQNRKVYTSFVDWLYVEAKRIGYNSVKHENTGNGYLQRFHSRRGLRRISGTPCSFIKDLRNE